MTTGSTSIDNRQSISTDCGDSLAGYRYRKDWDGADGPRGEEHNYYCVVDSEFSEQITWKQGVLYPGPYTGTYPSCFGGLWKPPLSVDENDESRLVNKVMSKFRQHDFNAAVNLGELRESVKMIATTAHTLASAYTNLKRGNVPQALRQLGVKPKTSVVRDVQHDLRDSAANAWLGITYGWLPLLGAVDSAAEAAVYHLRPRTASVRSRVKKVGPSSYEAYVPVSVKREESINLIWKIEEEARWSTLEEFGFLSPELVAWELMPYSFVVDWFLPIGNFLEARSYLNSVKGTYIRTRRSVANLDVGPGKGNVYEILSGSYRTRSFSLARTTGSIESMPLPAPTLKNPWGASHAVSAIALLQKAFSTRT